MDHCCRADFAFRRHCFGRLEADTTYALPSVSALIPALREDWCQAHKEDKDLQNKKHRYELPPSPFLQPKGTSDSETLARRSVPRLIQFVLCNKSFSLLATKQNGEFVTIVYKQTSSFLFLLLEIWSIFHQAGIWKEGSGSESESYWTGANEVDSFYVGTENVITFI